MSLYNLSKKVFNEKYKEIGYILVNKKFIIKNNFFQGVES